MTDILLLCLLTIVASAVGTATGFGTSTIMMPVLAAVKPPLKEFTFDAGSTL